MGVTVETVLGEIKLRAEPSHCSPELPKICMIKEGKVLKRLLPGEPAPSHPPGENIRVLFIPGECDESMEAQVLLGILHSPWQEKMRMASRCFQKQRR